ncbi:MAG: hypothetical protein ACXWJU_02405 [Hyphomicrobium sp.]|jgi:hypothetical protein
MRHMLTIAAIAALAASTALAPVFAEDRPITKGPTKSLGDEGKLPPTSTMSDKVPDMTGPDVDTSAQGAGDGTAPTRPDATVPKRMGDEGKLPATSTMTKQVPEMTGKPSK